MINAGFHLLAWGLVIMLVWANWFQAPEAKPGDFSAVAALDEGFYLIASQGQKGSQFGLLKYQKQALGFRSLVLEDWEGVFAGNIEAMCAVKNYPGEVVVLVDTGTSSRLVHLQVRRWSGSPKTAVLSHLDLAPGEHWQSLACGQSTQQQMPISLERRLGGQSELLQAQLQFKPLMLVQEQRQSRPLAPAQARYWDERGEWRSYFTATGSRVSLWAGGLERDVYRMDGIHLVGLAAGDAQHPLSYIAAHEGLGNVWRPLAPANSLVSTQ